MSGTIGFVLVGQSGRDDVLPVVRTLLGPGVEVAAKGALDGLSPAELARMAPVPGAAGLTAAAEAIKRLTV